MDATALFQSVLSPGEQLLWTGQPRKDRPISAGLTFVVIVAFVGRMIQMLWSIRPDPMPVLLQLELVLLAAMLAAGGGFLGRLMYRTWITAYAVTDRRLLMSVGPRHDRIRNLALTDLARVKIVFRPRAGKMLFFYKTGWTPGSGPSRVWTFLETGQTDTWKAVWSPFDAESVGRMIETARANVSGRVDLAPSLPG